MGSGEPNDDDTFSLVPPFAEPAPIAALTSSFYNESHRQLRSKVRRYVDEHILPHQLDWEAKGEVPAEAVRHWRESGLSHTYVPREYRTRPEHQKIGGIVDAGALDVFHELVLTDEMSRIEGGVGIGLERGANLIGLPPVLHHGTQAQKDRWLPGLLDGTVSFCLGITEPTGGSDVSNIRTRAVLAPDASHYVVTGHKKWITGAPYATHMTTAVRTGGPGVPGISLLVVPLRQRGVAIRRIANSGQAAGAASWVALDGVRVPADHLLGAAGAGFKLIMTNFNRERFALAAACNRKARTCLAAAWAYARERETFGAPLLARQAVRHKLVGVARRAEAHWAWLEALAAHVQSAPARWLDAAVAGRMALCKVEGGQLLELAAREAQQVLGGAGYQRGNVVEQITRDLRMLVVGGGSEEVMNDLAFREEEKRYRQREAKM